MKKLEIGLDAVEAVVRALASASETETTDEAQLLSGGWHLIQPPKPLHSRLSTFLWVFGIVFNQ